MEQAEGEIRAEDHLEFAQMIAYQTMSTWPPSVWEEGLADAYLGLVKAARSYVPGGKANFHTYAKWVIRGAVIDGLRQRVGRDRRGVRRPREIPLDAPIEDKDGSHSLELGIPDHTATDLIEAAERRLLSEAIATLSDRDRLVVVLYFFCGMFLHELGTLLGLTESRMSQIVSEISGKLRSYLTAQDLR